jgi:hypothetical protein
MMCIVRFSKKMMRCINDYAKKKERCFSSFAPLYDPEVCSQHRHYLGGIPLLPLVSL